MSADNPMPEAMQAPLLVEEEAQDDSALFARLEAEWLETKAWWAPVREKARKARNFYHLLQWTEEQRRILAAEGRPDTIVALIPRAVDNICGRERAARYDFKAAPVGANDVLSASAMTHGLKSIARQTDAKYTLSDGFEDAVLGPMGWNDVTRQDEDPTQNPEVVDHPAWDEMYFDPRSRHKGLKDARWVIRVRTTTLEAAIEDHPEHEEALKAAVITQRLQEPTTMVSDYGNRDDGTSHKGETGPVFGKGSDVVEIREHQYWAREAVDYLELPNGERFYEEDCDQARVDELYAMGATLEQGKRRCYYIALVGAGKILRQQKLGLPFDGFSYVPIWCKRDSQGRPYGLVDVMIPLQEEVNVARSRMNEALRSVHMLYETGALGNTTEAQASKKIAHASWAMEVKDLNGVRLSYGAEVASYWANMMDMAKAEIDAVVGNNEAAYGDKSNEKSGIAIAQRVEQQAKSLGKIFDLLSYSRKEVGMRLLTMLQKYRRPEELERIIGAQVSKALPAMRLGPNGSPIPMPEADLSWVGQVLAGPAYQLRYDVEIEDQAETTTQRQAETQQRIDVLQMIPDQLRVIAIPDTIRGTDWVGAEELAGKLEQAMSPQPMPGPLPGPPMGQGMPPEMLPQPPAGLAGFPPPDSQVLPPALEPSGSGAFV